MNNLCIHNLIHIAEFTGELTLYFTLKQIYKYRIVNVTNTYFYKSQVDRDTMFNTIHDKKQIRFNGDLYHWNITHNNLQLLSELSNVELNLYNFSDSAFNYLIDYFVNVNTLKLNWIGTWAINNLIDISKLKNVSNLTLRNAPPIKNINILKNAHTLYLDNIFNVDISELKNVNTLTLNRLYIRDVSMLGTVRNLTLIECNNITDISKLMTVQKLTIHNCMNVQLNNLQPLFNLRYPDILKKMVSENMYLSITNIPNIKKHQIHVKISKDYVRFFLKNNHKKTIK